MNEDTVTVVFKSNQMTLLWCHSTALCWASWGKGLFVHLCLKYRLMDVSFITTVSCILKPTHVCGIHHILWQWTPLFNYDFCGKFLGFHVLNFLTACFIWSVSCVMKNSGKAFFIHFLLMNFLCYDTVLSLICPPSNMKILKLFFFPLMIEKPLHTFDHPVTLFIYPSFATLWFWDEITGAVFNIQNVRWAMDFYGSIIVFSPTVFCSFPNIS